MTCQTLQFDANGADFAGVKEGGRGDVAVVAEVLDLGGGEYWGFSFMRHKR